MTKRRETIAWALALAIVAAPAFAARVRITRGETCPYRIVTRHFVVEFSVSPRVGVLYARLCEKAYKRFSDIFQVPPTETVWEGACHVYLFEKQEQFARFASGHHGVGAALSGGYAVPRKRDPLIVLYRRGRTDVALQQTLIHEMTHVFLQLFHREVHLNTWLHEGFAQYFEFLHHPSQSRRSASRRLAKRLVRSGKARPLEEFWVAVFPPTDSEGYAQAWSLVDFMTASKELRRKTGKFILALKDRAPERHGFVQIRSAEDIDRAAAEGAKEEFQFQAKVFEEVFGIPVKTFEARWKRYVLATY